MWMLNATVGHLRSGLRRLGMHRVAWKLRRLDFPAGSGQLVLDVGSGAKPNPLADVVLERDPDGLETNVGPARSLGAALVWGDAERMPFRSKAFDLALCFHVLEHVDDPEACLVELERVAKAGYIETPNEIFDIVCPYVHHRNRVTFDGRVLRVFRKGEWDVDRFAERYGRLRVSQVLEALGRDPANLHVQYPWRDRIEWVVEEELLGGGGQAALPDLPAQAGGEGAALNTLAARVFRRRAMTDDRLAALLRCLECGQEGLRVEPSRDVSCPACGKRYRRFRGHLDLRAAVTA